MTRTLIKTMMALVMAAVLLSLAGVALDGSTLQRVDADLPWDRIMGGVLIACLVIYSLTGGADYGGGIWDMFASGPRAQDQRKLIRSAIGPIWEANHVWLIVIVVVLFTNFPTAFAAISNALHIPLTLMLLGIVMRGSAFIFRSYDRSEYAGRWGLLFSIASAFTPIMLGVCVGALSSGSTQFDEQQAVVSGFVQTWWHPFPWAAGVYTLTLFAYLAATYLAEYTSDEALQEDFRLRAMASAWMVAVLALLCLFVARSSSPVFFEGLTQRPWSLAMHVLTGIVSISAFACLWRRHYTWARLLVAAQVGLIVLGWAFAQYPYLFMPLPISAGAAPFHVMKLTFTILVVGSILLVPSFIYLLKIFAHPPQTPHASPAEEKTQAAEATEAEIKFQA